MDSYLKHIKRKFQGKTAKIRGFVGPVIYVGPSKKSRLQWRVGIKDAHGRAVWGNVEEAEVVEGDGNV